tara:strand:- start:40642 stop:41103 length:462 start_codon:yes stop_codon:yes gene_type:complete
MSKPKSRNKKYNSANSIRLKNMELLKNRVVVYFVNDDIPEQDIILTSIKGDAVTMTQSIAAAISDYPYMWSVMLAVFCAEKNKKTVKLELVKFKHRYHQKDLVNYLNEHQKSLLKKFTDKNVNITGAGWIASPHGTDISESDTGIIFEKLGAI